MSGAFRSRRNLLLFACSLAVTLWLFILSLQQQQLTDQLQYAPGDRNTGSEAAESRGAELREETLRLNSSAEFLRALESPKRPLLVRFDWYSRKTTPVHIG